MPPPLETEGVKYPGGGKATSTASGGTAPSTASVEVKLPPQRVEVQLPPQRVWRQSNLRSECEGTAPSPASVELKLPPHDIYVFLSSYLTSWLINKHLGCSAESNIFYQN